MTTEKITPADQTDSPAIFALQKRAFVTEVLAHGKEDIEPLRQTPGQHRADFADHSFLKATAADGTIVGSVKYRALDDSVWVGRLIVDIAHRGRGLGRRLLAEVEARNPEATAFRLCTAAGSAHNIRLYESVGYRVTGTFRDPAQEGFEMVEMVKTV